MSLLTTIGFFDGVHLGHTFLINMIKEKARMLGLTPSVVTFSQHPKGVISGKEIKVLTPAKEKIERLAKAGIEHCIVLPFTKELSLMSARDFMIFLRDRHDVRAIMMGFDNGFGHSHKETFDKYEAIGEELDIKVMLGEGKLVNGEKIGSTKIRSMLEHGDIEDANALLGYRYAINGTVVEGRHIGTSIGFPTANIHLTETEKLLPATGVYAAIVNGSKAMLNIGTNPTVSDAGNISIEVHIIGGRGNLYGQTMRIELVKRLRDEIHFHSIDDLKNQLNKDKAEVISLFSATNIHY